MNEIERGFMLKIIISPAKKMKQLSEFNSFITTPSFIKEAAFLRAFLRTLPVEELKKLWQCSDALTTKNREQLHTFALSDSLTPAILSYEGIQYQYMAPQVFSEAQWSYVSKNLRILSGFYGILKPTDGVIPYRLEMQAKLLMKETKNLYTFWNERLYAELFGKNDYVDCKSQNLQIINLASVEYSKAILPYIKEPASCITCVFGEEVQGKIKVKGTQAKMARGEMVRWMAEHNIEHAEDIKQFNSLCFHFDKDRSSKQEYVFLKM